MANNHEKIYARPPIATEDPNDYRSGGFCPIYLGDTLHGRYKIFRKLGDGSQSTVWLAKDLSHGFYVAIKVHSAKDDAPAVEHAHHPNVEHMYDHFELKSANGKHVCIALQPLGRSLRKVMNAWLPEKIRLMNLEDDEAEEEDDDQIESSDDEPETLDDEQLDESDDDVPPEDPDEKYNPHQWPTKLAREICRQVLAGIDSLHTQGISHRDVQPGNIAFALSYDINSLSANEVQQDCWDDNSPERPITDEDWDAINLRNSSASIAQVERCDQKPLGPDEIKYVAAAHGLHDRLIFDESPPLRVVLIDLGFSRPIGDCNHPIFTPDNYRPPEAILPLPITYKADIFSAAIVLWEIVMTRNIVWTQYGNNGADNDKYLRDLAARIGSLPANIAAEYSLEASTKEEEELEEYDLAYGDMKFAARRDGPRDMTEQETGHFVDLMTQMMQWEAEKRPDAKELLKHPFFSTTEK